MATEIIVPSNDDKNIATMTHLAGTVFSFVPALIVWILKKSDSAFIADQSKEALNFQITIAIAMFVCGSIFILGTHRHYADPHHLACQYCFCIIAAISTSKGETYRYPFCLRLIN